MQRFNEGNSFTVNTFDTTFKKGQDRNEREDFEMKSNINKKENEVMYNEHMKILNIGDYLYEGKLFDSLARFEYFEAMGTKANISLDSISIPEYVSHYVCEALVEHFKRSNYSSLNEDCKQELIVSYRDMKYYLIGGYELYEAICNITYSPKEILDLDSLPVTVIEFDSINEEENTYKLLNDTDGSLFSYVRQSNYTGEEAC